MSCAVCLVGGLNYGGYLLNRGMSTAYALGASLGGSQGMSP